MTCSIFGGIIENDVQRKVSCEMPRSHVAALSYRSEVTLDRAGVQYKSGSICVTVVCLPVVVLFLYLLYVLFVYLYENALPNWLEILKPLTQYSD